MSQSAEFNQIVQWLAEERTYQIKKFGLAVDDDHIKQGVGEDSWLWQQITNYVGRMKIFGLDSPLGRQAYMKLIATTVGLGEAMIRVYGEVPPAGVSSGELK